MSARSSALLDIDVDGDREADRRAVQGQGEAARRQRAGAASRPRLGADAISTCPIGAARASAPTRSATASSSKATRAAALGAVYGGATVCAWYPITPSSSLAEAFTGYCQQLRVDPETGKNKLRHRPGRGRARLDRHGDRRRLERRARLHRDLRPRHLADAGVHRPRLLRRDPGGDLRRAARRPLDRHADAHAAVRHHLAAPTPRTATPSTCCCSRKTRPKCFEFGAQAFDLADRLQTPIFVMLDLDIGMNHRLCAAARMGRQRAATTAAR